MITKLETINKWLEILENELNTLEGINVDIVDYIIMAERLIDEEIVKLEAGG